MPGDRSGDGLDTLFRDFGGGIRRHTQQTDRWHIHAFGQGAENAIKQIAADIVVTVRRCIRAEADLSHLPASARTVAVRMIHASGDVDLTLDDVRPLLRRALKLSKPRLKQPTIGGGLHRTTVYRRRQNCGPMTAIWMENCGLATNEFRKASSMKSTET